MKVLFVAVLVAVAAASNVVVLTDANFGDNVDGSKHTLLEFYAPWCGHCKRLTPEYETLADAYAKAGDVMVAKVDCDDKDNKGLCSRWGVSGFPTLKWLPKGKTEPAEAEDYNSGRTADAMSEFIAQKSGVRGRIKKLHDPTTVLSDANFDEIVLAKDKHVLVEFYAPWCGHCKALAPKYEQLARVFENEPNVVIAKYDADSHKKAAGKYGISGFPTLKYFGPESKEKPDDYNGAREVKDMVNFINEHAKTVRQDNGQLGPSAGRIAALDKLAKGFSGDKSVIDEAKSTIAELDAAQARAGKIYNAYFSRIAANKDFAKNEIARLGRLLEGDIAAKKVDDLTIRQNIAKAFTEE